VRWNIDKHYLFDLEQWGIPIVPTALASTVDSDAFRKLFLHRQIHSAILKPVIGLGGSDSYRVLLDELDDMLESLRIHETQHDYLIQPFIETVVSEGEWSFIYFNRQLSHVLLKKPAPNDYRVQGIYGGSIQAADPSHQDLLQAESVIARLPFDILYGRLDFVRVDGRLSIIEVELIEPIFSFHLVPDSIARLVQATHDKLEQ
jgi:glutathione synthase/RimK-type ligase-like ATP-grasp enzyme